uniref:Uncharacterized protein n=1 Tax=Anguilla anguilla TaxID=7936 RepID=A0A0E9VV05_ANGAN
MLAFKRLPTSGYWVAHPVKALFWFMDGLYCQPPCRTMLSWL